jgi:hypothetical protein
MTKTEAKEIALEMWRYLKDNPELEDKTQVPKEMLDKLDTMYYCALCEVFPKCKVHYPLVGNEINCPLYNCIDGPYIEWVCCHTIEGRKKYATEVVKLIEAWEVTNE